MTKFKIAFALFATILTIIVVIQNTEAVETNILFFTVTLPRALLFAVLFAAGIVVGLLLAYSLSDKKPDAD